MKKFTIPCDFGGEKHPFQVYVGDPGVNVHPLYYQQRWLSDERGGYIPPEVMDSFEKLQKIAVENDVNFEELCMYALGQAAEEKAAEVKDKLK
ncbi:MAG TPA: DUF2610 domain-containing protein [Flavilitoribacter sp.]|nr:DUF2610 domain-containing protein [Flavilitoribacter sp.]HMQ87674.1 DUF2610 domain-containing protein [Flavilitoribacter sp.]